MTNNQIVEYIYKNIDIDKFILKVISSSYVTKTKDDLKQYIYLYFLEMDNEKLNNLYRDKVISQFIMKTILNQRNYYRSYFNIYCKNNNNNDDIDKYNEICDDDSDTSEKHRKLKFIEDELKCDNNIEYKNDEYLRYEILKIYMTRKYTIKELSVKYKISYNTLFRLLKETKKIIQIKYDDYNNNNPDNKYNI